MFSLSSVALLAFLCVSPGSAAVSWNFRRDTSGPSVWDYSPNFSNDTFPPWPPLEDDSGKRIDVANLRGTRLFGWEGCTAEDANKIKEAWEDRWNLVKDDDIKKNINWKGQAAEEFGGPPTKIPDYRKQQIQHIYSNIEQMWSYWWAWEPPWLSWRRLYIEVTCSGGNGKGDPDNICGDREDPNKQPPPPQCPPGNDGSPGQELEEEQERMHAFSTNPSRKNGLTYSRITFCNLFFNMRSMSEAKTHAMRQSPTNQRNLEFWENRARVFLHETTHLEYFMETPKKADYVRDLKMSIKNVAVDPFAYGPYYARILRNWNKNPGYYTQKNADTYAWYAVAIWVQKLINTYPNLPAAGSKRPKAAPRDEDGNSLNSIDTDPEEDPALTGIAEIEHEGDPDFKIPGCADKFHVADENPPPPYTAECSADPGAVPYNVFAGQSGNVFGDFCDGIDTAKDLKTTVDASGKVIKRTPPPNPATWKNYKFHLEYAAGADRGCKKTCNDAFQSLKAACGSKGGHSNEMSTTGSINVGCGTYSYAIEKFDYKPDPASTTPLTLQERVCFDKDAFSKHGDVYEMDQRFFTGIACGGTADKVIKKGIRGAQVTYQGNVNDVLYTYNIFWMDGCEMDVDEVNAMVPLGKTGEGVTCTQFMIDNYKKCNNGGIGGTIQAGCVVYEFKASEN
ncbi:unnamed protein product [Colletotrichum noveboracense]|uniref:Oviduct-specific glycoprotein n=1 Tax=Colletotrichum noveboracense TaxID=2664923 RepID=A0A9W4S6Z7_9PEZI|nr:unnamed protein product [Colletotrichum noveboracense]